MGAAALGPAFGFAKAHNRTPTIPSGDLQLLDRVVEIAGPGIMLDFQRRVPLAQRGERRLAGGERIGRPGMLRLGLGPCGLGGLDSGDEFLFTNRELLDPRLDRGVVPSDRLGLLVEFTGSGVECFPEAVQIGTGGCQRFDFGPEGRLAGVELIPLPDDRGLRGLVGRLGLTELRRQVVERGSLFRQRRLGGRDPPLPLRKVGELRFLPILDVANAIEMAFHVGDQGEDIPPTRRRARVGPAALVRR
jgi:hypothetical protein